MAVVYFCKQVENYLLWMAGSILCFD